MNSTIDSIEREIFLQVPRACVWRALSNAEEFGDWFGVALKGKTFAAGKRVQGQITYPGYEHLVMEVVVQKMEHERLFSFLWHPYAVDPKVDYSKEPRTLVEFRLEKTASGTLLVVTESGFDAIPVARRAEAFRMNAQGWAVQLENIGRHVAG